MGCGASTPQTGERHKESATSHTPATVEAPIAESPSAPMAACCPGSEEQVQEKVRSKERCLTESTRAATPTEPDDAYADFGVCDSEKSTHWSRNNAAEGTAHETFLQERRNSKEKFAEANEVFRDRMEHQPIKRKAQRSNTMGPTAAAGKPICKIAVKNRLQERRTSLGESNAHQLTVKMLVQQRHGRKEERYQEFERHKSPDGHSQPVLLQPISSVEIRSGRCETDPFPLPDTDTSDSADALLAPTVSAPVLAIGSSKLLQRRATRSSLKTA